MKRCMTVTLFLLVICASCFAGETNWFDIIRTLPYSVNPVDRTIVGASTYRDMNDTAANFFNDYNVFYYMPLGPADIRIENNTIKTGGNTLRLGTLFNIGLAGIQAAYEKITYASGTVDDVVHVDLMFDNSFFVWGVGGSQYANPPASYFAVKIGKYIDLGTVALDLKLASTTQDTGGWVQQDMNVKMMLKLLPIYIGYWSYSEYAGPITTNSQIVELGALFNI